MGVNCLAGLRCNPTLSITTFGDHQLLPGLSPNPLGALSGFCTDPSQPKTPINEMAFPDQRINPIRRSLAVISGRAHVAGLVFEFAEVLPMLNPPLPVERRDRLGKGQYTEPFGYSITRLKLLGVELTGSANVRATASHSSGLGTPRARI